MPELETLGGLLDQHAEAVDRVAAAGAACPGEEVDRGVAVAQIDRERVRIGERKRQRQRCRCDRAPCRNRTRSACGRGCVDDQVEVAERAQILPVARVHAGRIALRIGQRVGAFGRAVDDHQFADPGVQQGRRDSGRRSAGAEQQRAPLAQVVAVAIGQIAHQSRAIGVVAAPTATVAQQGIHRAGTLRACAQRTAQRQRDRLVRHGDIGAGTAVVGEFLQHLRERSRRRIDGDVIHRDAALLRERRVDALRQRVRDGVSEDGELGAHVVLVMSRVVLFVPAAVAGSTGSPRTESGRFAQPLRCIQCEIREDAIGAGAFDAGQ